MKKPIKANLHKANTGLTAEDISQLTNRKFETEGLSQKQITENRQKSIDQYNFGTCNIIDNAFDNINFVGTDVIVRLHKENYIKAVEFYANGEPVYDAWISQVDGRMTQHAPANWVDNPLPYIFTGVIVAMSPSAKEYFNKQKEMMKDSSSYKIPTVGDLVNLEHFMIADKRFYLNKQKRDFIKNPTEYKIEHWEGYVKIHPGIIESVILDKDEYAKTSSPFYNYYKKTEVN